MLKNDGLNKLLVPVNRVIWFPFLQNNFVNGQRESDLGDEKGKA